MKIRRSVAAALVIGLSALAGCGPSTDPTSSPTAPTPVSPTTTPTQSPTSTPTQSPTPTPTHTWDAGQAAAIAAVQGLFGVSDKIGADPAAFSKKEMTKLFKQYVGGEMIDANVDSFMTKKANGWRWQGRMVPVSIKPTKVADNHNERGLEVHVTVCQDQTALTIVDTSGVVVADEQAKIPAFLLRQYSVRKPTKSDTWLVFGMQTIPGECGP